MWFYARVIYIVKTLLSDFFRIQLGFSRIVCQVNPGPQIHWCEYVLLVHTCKTRVLRPLLLLCA